MEKKQPILSCAGREAVSIDTVLLTELLLSFRTTTIGIKEKASQVADSLRMITDGAHPNDGLERFKEIITTEFLYVQLVEASKFAKRATAVPEVATYNSEDIF